MQQLAAECRCRCGKYWWKDTAVQTREIAQTEAISAALASQILIVPAYRVPSVRIASRIFTTFKDTRLLVPSIQTFLLGALPAKPRLVCHKCCLNSRPGFNLCSLSEKCWCRDSAEFEAYNMASVGSSRRQTRRIQPEAGAQPDVAGICSLAYS